jgi:hypothetical protein
MTPRPARTPRRRPAPEPRGPEQLAIGIASTAAAMVVVIEEHWLPWTVSMHLRDWWLHFFGVLATTLLTGLLLGVHRRPWRVGRPDHVRQLACCVPFLFLALHELGQWLYPDGARDTFDSVRDCAMNAAGTVTAWCLQRRLRPNAPEPHGGARMP